MLKTALFDCAINEMLHSFSSPPREIDSSRVLTPGNLPYKAEKMLMPGGQPGEGGWWGGGQLELTDALKRSWPGTSNTAIWAS